MLGRTHMSIGALGAVAAYSLMQHTRWESIGRILHSPSGALSHAIVPEATVVFASVVGSIIPDLDQPDSKMAHKVERIGQVAMIAVLFAFMILLHLEGSLTAWIFVLVLSWLSSTRGNTSRLVGLGILGAGTIFMSMHHDIPTTSGILLAIWTVGAMFTHHRTFTHSLLGLAIFGVGVGTALSGYSHLHLALASDGLILGYALHMAADGVAGGVPLFWPWKHRQGIRLVRTGSAVDHMIGGIATVAFLGLIVF
ncbi:metal-dependent hydrolase [Alicyclobacillus tolerans]|uniref:metal-dependent hydrolase n=1 Tax=Alicyclobacillus tolerans TaxID=90970 RepID=UPI001F1FA09C|nr:metal-dependent hydrolase [Alicyclobacillus tolerans]MCF8567679.1 metal-dependent hydrolase [Alicyclobacillus tolerans]